MTFISKVITKLRLWRNFSKQDKEISKAIQRIIGGIPDNIAVYNLALRHISASPSHQHQGVKQKDSNERLEYLGDAMLGAVIAEFLFRKYPFEDEGFLTEIRSRIVNRESLNRLSQKIGLTNLISHTTQNTSKTLVFRSISGDALEALVGAVYLDKGFNFCKRFIIKKLLLPYYDLEEVIANNKNFKSIIIEWAQKENKEIKFEVVKETGTKYQKEFTIQIIVNDKNMTLGYGSNKKKAEQDASKKACELLKISL